MVESSSHPSGEGVRKAEFGRADYQLLEKSRKACLESIARESDEMMK